MKWNKYPENKPSFQPGSSDTLYVPCLVWMEVGSAYVILISMIHEGKWRNPQGDNPEFSFDESKIKYFMELTSLPKPGLEDEVV